MEGSWRGLGGELGGVQVITQAGGHLSRFARFFKLPALKTFIIKAKVLTISMSASRSIYPLGKAQVQVTSMRHIIFTYFHLIDLTKLIETS